MYILHLFLLLCILQQNHQTKKGTNSPNGVSVKETQVFFLPGEWLESLSHWGSLPLPALHGSCFSGCSVLLPPCKTPSHGLVIWTVSWHVGTMDPKPYKLGKAQVSRFLSSDPARSILLIHINSAKSAKAEWQLLHEKERELRPNTFLTLLEDQVAPSSKWRLPGLLSTGTVVFTTIFQKLRHYFRFKIIEIIKVLI